MYRASLWSGTAGSWVDLHPAGASESVALGTSGTQQVGAARVEDVVGGVYRASLWSGTAASWVDLHSLLPGGPSAWRDSSAESIWSDGTTTYVAGSGHNLATGRGEALLWTLPLPPSCPADFNNDNAVDFFDYLDFVDAFSSQLPAADFNGDSSIDFFDYLDFVDAFSIGC